MSVTLHIVDLWQYYVFCIRSGVIPYTLFMALYLCRCACSEIYSLCSGHTSAHELLIRLVPEPSQYRKTLSVSVEWILLTLYSMVALTAFKSMAHAFLLAWLLAPFLLSTVFPLSVFFLFFGDWGLWTPSLALLTSFNNNNIHNNNKKNSG